MWVVCVVVFYVCLCVEIFVGYELWDVEERVKLIWLGMCECEVEVVGVLDDGFLFDIEFLV